MTAGSLVRLGRRVCRFVGRERLYVAGLLVMLIGFAMIVTGVIRALALFMKLGDAIAWAGAGIIVLSVGERMVKAWAHAHRSPREDAEPIDLADPFPIPLYDGCPDCGSLSFRLGPQGGVCVNVECTRCQSRYNLCEPIGRAHRIPHDGRPFPPSPFDPWRASRTITLN